MQVNQVSLSYSPVFIISTMPWMFFLSRFRNILFFIYLLFSVFGFIFGRGLFAYIARKSGVLYSSTFADLMRFSATWYCL